MNHVKSLVLVVLEGWEGIYLDGELHIEGGQVYQEQWVELISERQIFAQAHMFTVSQDYQEQFEAKGKLPKLLESIPKEHLF